MPMPYPPFANVIKAVKEHVVDGIWLRDWLEVSINKEASNTVLYILMNPSKADQEECDDTVEKLLNFTMDQSNDKDSVIPDVGTVIIVNLFPFYKTESNKLYEVLLELTEKRGGYEDLMKANMRKIRKAIKKSQYIVLGWGDAPKHVDEWHHRELCSGILKVLHKSDDKQVFVFHSTREKTVTRKRNPRHPIIISLKGLEKCKIKPMYTVQVR
ncbi:DUF1643 domain-containing protein [Paenibacillus alkalitolerans]|uniref:DUF1643 domain-containing protein n=1 Tax=Paenibacillus alkalitolerans TaxID=2799335 RepID=UPI0018F77F3F|nr:DUF1643 domain-containing protein [Paenibacillus alkalitolerans]